MRLQWSHFMANCRISLVALLLFAGNSVVFALQDSKGTPNSRIRIVPQSSDGLMTGLEENRSGTRLVTSNQFQLPRLWDSKRQILLSVLDGHVDSIGDVKFSESGEVVITQSMDRVRIWDSLRGNLISEYVSPPDDLWTCVSYSPSSDHVVIGSMLGKVFLGQRQGGALIQIASEPKNRVNCLSFSNDGKLLSIGRENGGDVFLFNSKKLLFKYTNPKGATMWTVFSPNSNWLAVTNDAGSAELYSIQSKKLKISYPHFVGSRGVKTEFCGASFVGMEKNQLLTTAKNGELKLYPLGSSSPSSVLRGHSEKIRELRLSYDRQFAATYGHDDKMKLWNLVTGQEIPIKDLIPGLPTAASFSPTKPVFWVGYSGDNGGSICQLNVLTGKIETSLLGSVVTLGKAGLVGDDPVLRLSTRGGDSLGYSSKALHLFFDIRGTNRPFPVLMDWETISSSLNGKYYAIENVSTASSVLNGNSKFWILDPFSNQLRVGLTSVVDSSISSDSSMVAILGTNGSVDIFDIKTGQNLKSWVLDKPSDEIKNPKGSTHLQNIYFLPDGKTVLTGPHPGNSVQVWDWNTGNVIRSVTLEMPATEIVLSKNGRRFAAIRKSYLLSEPSGIVVYDLDSGKKVASFADKNRMEFGEKKFSDDGRLLYSCTYGYSLLLDCETGVTKEFYFDTFIVSPNGLWYAVSTGSEVTIYNLKTNLPHAKLQAKDSVGQLLFTSNPTRFLTLDENGGLTVWKIPSLSDSNTGSASSLTKETPEAKRLCQVVVMRNGEWLVYDDQGRYDAPDPASVEGAYFILNWKGGMEAINMAQLKSVFYEPGLLAKCFELDSEVTRDVPSLEDLHLYPEISISKSRGLTVDVRIKERDEGGIGLTTFYLNGKQILQRRGVGYFQLDLTPYLGYFLPANLLPAGKGNELTVQVRNQKGDLISPFERLDLGVPDGLKPPPVKLHALFVGAGNYVGQEYDLQAPPLDAEALASAVREVASRLLPERVFVTSLTTRADDLNQRPTRTNILSWFSKVKAESSSSDVVMVYFAGHGVNKIGDNRDYFFLTSEANPADITSTAIATSTVSGEDLKKLLSSLPANKQIVILDTCHSGAASGTLIEKSRSVSGDYQRAWESIRESTGTWMLAGASADQKSYESTNVDHGMLTYALLEAIDQASPEALRPATGGDLFVDVEKWLGYATTRVETLKNEVGIRGAQQPEFRKATAGGTFDIGVMRNEKRGFLGLKAPMPVVIVGNFEQDQEDPLSLDGLISTSMKSAQAFKAWFDRPKHPNVYRIAGTYSVSSDVVTVKVFIQKFDANAQRKTIETHEVKGTTSQLTALAERVRTLVETRIRELEPKQPSSRSN